MCWFVAPGCSAGIRWPWRCTCGQWVMMAMRQEPAMWEHIVSTGRKCIFHGKRSTTASSSLPCRLVTNFWLALFQDNTMVDVLESVEKAGVGKKSGVGTNKVGFWDVERLDWSAEVTSRQGFLSLFSNFQSYSLQTIHLMTSQLSPRRFIWFPSMFTHRSFAT
jgi:hypothetical protein